MSRIYFLYAMQRKSCNFSWEITNRVYQQAWQKWRWWQRHQTKDNSWYNSSLVWSDELKQIYSWQNSQDFFRYYGSVLGSYKHSSFFQFCILFSLKIALFSCKDIHFFFYLMIFWKCYFIHFFLYCWCKKVECFNLILSLTEYNMEK